MEYYTGKHQSSQSAWHSAQANTRAVRVHRIVHMQTQEHSEPVSQQRTRLPPALPLCYDPVSLAEITVDPYLYSLIAAYHHVYMSSGSSSGGSASAENLPQEEVINSLAACSVLWHARDGTLAGLGRGEEPPLHQRCRLGEDGALST